VKLFGLLLVTIGVMLFVPCSALAANPASAPLPLDSWIYPAIDKLSGLGVIDSSLQGSRPYSRLEAARLTDEARKNSTLGSYPPVVAELLRRMESELREQLIELGVVEGTVSPGYFKPLRSAKARYIYQEGVSSAIPAIDSRQFSLNTNNFGIDYDEHHNGELVIEGDARVGGIFLLHWRPLYLAGDEGDSFRLLEGTAAVSLGHLELSAGRQSLWWGQGRHGSLLLTNNAKPLDMVRLTNPSPVLLPWFLSRLGPFRFDLFVSRLEEERVVPEPWFGGLRLNIKPFPWLELGAARTVMFGGEGRPDVDFEDFLTIIGGENLTGEEDTSNSVAALDIRLRLAPLGGAELYGELGGEDEYQLLGFIPFISNKAWLAGLYLPVLEPSRRLSLRLEYASLDHEDSNSPIWYRHGIYQSGYTYKKKIMGHHVGGGGTDLFAEIRAILPGAVTLGLSFDYEKRGVDQIVEEKHYQPAVELEWRPSARVSFNARYAFDKVENFSYIAGNDQKFHLAEFGLTSIW